MLKQTARLLCWALLRNPLRTLFLVLTIIGSMAAFSTTEATLRDLANQASDIYRLISYDLEVTGETVFDRERNIAEMAGVSVTERALRCHVSVNGMSGDAVVRLGEGLLFPVEFSQGRAPEKSNEIAITRSMAALGKIAPGDTVDVAWGASSAEIEGGEVLSAPAASFLVCGIAEYKAGSACILTEDGLQRIHANPARTTLLFVKTDGTVKPEVIGSRIREMNRASQITIMDDSDDPILSVATMLTQTISLIMLAAGVGGFYMLLSLSQRERLYDLGILRAVGVSSTRLIVQLILEGLLLLVLGALLGSVLIFSVTSVFHLGNLNTTLAQNLQPMLLLFALFLAVIVYSANKVGGRPATEMLRGER